MVHYDSIVIPVMTVYAYAPPSILKNHLITKMINKIIELAKTNTF